MLLHSSALCVSLRSLRSWAPLAQRPQRAAESYTPTPSEEYENTRDNEALAPHHHLYNCFHRSRRLRNRDSGVAVLRRRHGLQRHATHGRVALRFLLDHAVDLLAGAGTFVG